MLQVAIIGASGYSGEELVRLILRHPRVRLTCITSRQNAGKRLADVFPQFAKNPTAQQLKFIEPEVGRLLKHLGRHSQSSIVFLAMPHGVAMEWVVPLEKHGLSLIDLSADFRLKEAVVYRQYYGRTHPAPALLKRAVYGLTEIHRPAIRKARLIACPGCYPTSILLPLIPLLRAGLIQSDGIIADSLSGVSGSGRKVEDAFLFCECNESARPYGVANHRHLPEIEQELSLAARKRVAIQFTPHLIPMNRGILTTLYARPAKKCADIAATVSRCYQKVYGKEPFIRLLSQPFLPDTKNIAGSNMVEMAHCFDSRTGRLILFSALDNLTKGAAGQAVQNMNILFGFPETEGLF